MSKRIVILGGGESGTGAALLARAKGYDVFLSDAGPLQEKYRDILIANEIEFEEGQHSSIRIYAANEVIKSPGIPDKAPLIQELHRRGIPVVSELEFAARYTQARFIAITGSNGKTTTTLLTYHLLKEAGFNVGLAGNVGDSLARQVAEDRHEWYVLEVSSFQLDGMFSFKADIGILLNITPDHLDRYDYVFQNYVDSKFRILQNMTEADHFITFREDSVVQAELEKRAIPAAIHQVSLLEEPENGAARIGNELIFNLQGHRWVLSVEDLLLKGSHNHINCMCAVSAALLAGARPDAIKVALSTFQNAPHRLEEVATINGVKYVNDSKATNVDSVKYALGSFTEPVIWIAGGVDKGNDYSLLTELVAEKVKALVCMGKDNSPLDKAFAHTDLPMAHTGSIKEAVAKAAFYARPGDVVLLSPACASFDLFKNYIDRGEQFKEEVMALQQKKTL
jgi:UDP-N-acetylmuramoylalanine--D-glutamate ligase